MPTVRDEACALIWDVHTYKASAKKLEADVVGFARQAGISVVVTSRKRTCDEQAALYRAGRTTAAPTTSQHEFGFAFDVVPTGGFQQYRATKAQAIRWLVALAEYYGGFGLAEGSHAHLTVYSNTAWKRFLAARSVIGTVPIPRRSPKRG